MLEINNININVNVLLDNVPNYEKKPINIKKNILDCFLNMNNDSHILYAYENPIEWTPIKLCQTVYYLLRTQDEFWIVKYSKINGLKYIYINCIQDLLITKINSPINFNTRAPIYLMNMHIHNLRTSINGTYNFLCATNDNYNFYDNYIIKWNDKIHYIQLVY
jgi:hypothetical protein